MAIGTVLETHVTVKIECCKMPETTKRQNVVHMPTNILLHLSVSSFAFLNSNCDTSKMYESFQLHTYFVRNSMCTMWMFTQCINWFYVHQQLCISTFCIKWGENVHIAGHSIVSLYIACLQLMLNDNIERLQSQGAVQPWHTEMGMHSLRSTSEFPAGETKVIINPSRIFSKLHDGRKWWTRFRYSYPPSIAA